MDKKEVKAEVKAPVPSVMSPTSPKTPYPKKCYALGEGSEPDVPFTLPKGDE